MNVFLQLFCPNHICKTLTTKIKNVKNSFCEKIIKKYKNVEKKMLSAKVFGPTEKLLIKKCGSVVNT